MRTALKVLSIATAACLLQTAPNSAAQTVLRSGHIDVGIAYEDGAFELHIHDESTDTEYTPDAAILQLGAPSRRTVPNDPRFGFLGAPGSPVWLLSQVEEPNLIFLGLAAEEVESGVFVGDSLRMSLRAVNGPGNFLLYSTGGVTGNPDIRMNSADGISEDDFANVAAGGHTDYNWAFTAPGSYTVAFEASGTLTGVGVVGSGPVSYQFQVVPEPATIALFASGAAMLGLASRRQKLSRRPVQSPSR